MLFQNKLSVVHPTPYCRLTHVQANDEKASAILASFAILAADSADAAAAAALAIFSVLAAIDFARFSVNSNYEFCPAAFSHPVAFVPLLAFFRQTRRLLPSSCLFSAWGSACGLPAAAPSRPALAGVPVLDWDPAKHVIGFLIAELGVAIHFPCSYALQSPHLI